MSPSSYIDEIQPVIKAYSRPLQISIIQLLKIYGRLSTKELTDKLNRAKSTVLRHLDTLVDTGLVKGIEVKEGRGRYPTLYFELDPSKSMSIQGQKLREAGNLSSEEYELYLRTFQARYIQVREILDQCVTYLERQIEEVRQAEDSDALLKIGKDNLGQLILNYLPKSKIWPDFKGTPIDPVEGERNEYLEMNMVLPIRRLVETLNSDIWEYDGTIWPYD